MPRVRKDPKRRKYVHADTNLQAYEAMQALPNGRAFFIDNCEELTFLKEATKYIKPEIALLYTGVILWVADATPNNSLKLLSAMYRF